MSKADTLLASIYFDEAARHSIAEDVFPMAISYRQGEALKRLVSTHAPRVLVELGFRYGISSLWIQSARPRPKRHIIIDPYHHIPHPPKRLTIDTFIKRRPGVTLVESATSQEYMAHLVEAHETVDMAFIDASQWFDSVMTDMHFLTRLLPVGGVIVIRNLWSTPVRKAVMYYIKNLPYEPAGFLPWQVWVVRYIPYIGELYLRWRVRPLDLCVLTLVRKDAREWNHFVPF